jgi:hypothetical protein
MKLNFVLIFFALMMSLLSGKASAEVVICQLISSGQTYVAGQDTPPPRGKILASINQARLPAGETCDSWRAKKEKEVAAQGCVLLADGRQIFQGFGDNPPKRGTEIARGIPSQGQTCDAWREEKAAMLLTGISN